MGHNTHEIWLALHEHYPETARVTTEQWFKQDLLEEHLLSIEQASTLNGD
jgi:hypothetical protein